MAYGKHALVEFTSSKPLTQCLPWVGKLLNAEGSMFIQLWRSQMGGGRPWSPSSAACSCRCSTARSASPSAALAQPPSWFCLPSASPQAPLPGIPGAAGGPCCRGETTPSRLAGSRDESLPSCRLPGGWFLQTPLQSGGGVFRCGFGLNRPT